MALFYHDWEPAEGARVYMHLPAGLEYLKMSHVNKIQELRERARKQITEGAVTEDYQLDRKQVIGILNEALATEIIFLQLEALDHDAPGTVQQQQALLRLLLHPLNAGFARAHDRSLGRIPRIRQAA